MKDNEQPRQFNHLAATLLIGVAGIVSAIVGFFTTLFLVLSIPAFFGLNEFSGTVFVVAPGLAVIVGLLCAMLGGTAAGRSIDRFERRPTHVEFRDNKTGGIVTLVAKMFVWMFFLMFILEIFLGTIGKRKTPSARTRQGVASNRPQL